MHTGYACVYLDVYTLLHHILFTIHADELPSWRYTDKEQHVLSYRDEQSLLRNYGLELRKYYN